MLYDYTKKHNLISNLGHVCLGAIRSQLSRVNEGVRYQTSDYNLDNKP